MAGVTNPLVTTNNRRLGRLKIRGREMKKKQRKAKGAMGRAEIDTAAPFRSVKEAISLFALGDKILHVRREGGESERAMKSQSRVETLEADLRDTKEMLKTAFEDNKALSYRIKTLTEELETTKRELNALRMDPDVEVKTLRFEEKEEEERTSGGDTERRRSVKFASPPLLTKVIVHNDQKLIVKKKMKPLVPLAGWLFARNRFS